MLYAKEDRINNKLMFACRTCQYSEDAASACVFRNSIYNVIGETAGVTQDVGSDPTVGLPDICCTLCGQAITCDFCGGVDERGVEADESSSEDEEEQGDDEEEENSNDLVGEASGDQKPHETGHGGGAKAHEPFANMIANSCRDRTSGAPNATRVKRFSSNRNSDLRKRGW